MIRGSLGSTPRPSAKNMNETYLTLQGWVPHRLEMDGQVGLFLYNSHRHVVINKKDILFNVTIDMAAYEIANLKIVLFNDIPQNIIEEAINLTARC